MEFITELGLVLGLMPAFIIYMTEQIKPAVRDGLVFLIPYTVSLAAFYGLYALFGEYSIGLYLLNAIVFAFGTSAGYDKIKTNTLARNTK